MAGSVATKEDIARLEGKIETQGQVLEGKIIALNGKINLVYWMLGIIMLVQVIPHLKAFFG